MLPDARPHPNDQMFINSNTSSSKKVVLQQFACCCFTRDQLPAVYHSGAALHCMSPSLLSADSSILDLSQPCQHLVTHGQLLGACRACCQGCCLILQEQPLSGKRLAQLCEGAAAMARVQQQWQGCSSNGNSAAAMATVQQQQEEEEQKQSVEWLYVELCVVRTWLVNLFAQKGVLS
jgi:hypothetical protein